MARHTFANRTAGLVAVKTGVAAYVTPEQLENEVLRITRRIHGLTAKRRALKTQLAIVSKDLRAARRALKVVLQNRSYTPALDIGELSTKEQS